MSKKLSEKIDFWIGDRPDEWILKEWKRDAENLEAIKSELLKALESMHYKYGGYACAACDLADEAIAKAKGGCE